MNLENWLNEGHLKTHKPGKNEIGQLITVFERDVADARSTAISADRRFATAYNTALTIATAALAASGYRSAGEGHHFWTIQSLKFTLNLADDIVETFNRFCRKRNIIDYERIGTVSDHEVSEILALADSLLISLRQWLEENHPELILE